MTRQDLYDLVANSQLADVDLDSLATEARGYTVLASTNPPEGMAHGQLWWDMAAQLLRCFDSTLSRAFAIGPDCFESPALAACPLIRGACVRVDPVATYSANGNVCGIPWVRPVNDPLETVHAYGLVTDTATSGAVVPVAYGIAPAAFGATIYGRDSRYAYLTVCSGSSGVLVIGPEYGTLASMSWYTAICVERGFSDVGSAFSSQTYVKFVGPCRSRDGAFT